MIQALGAIALWATLAALSTRVTAVPPFLLTGIALLLGALVGAGAFRHKPPPAAALALGIYGLFGFHFFLFLALRLAPPVEANLVNYLWPLLIVVLAPVIVPGIAWSTRHGFAALMGFGGAALLITAGASQLGQGQALGYAFAVASAVIWSTYSLATRRFHHFPTGYVAWFCLVSGLLALACHAIFEPVHVPTQAEWPYIAALGVGPMGFAFYLWDRALKRGDPRTIGNLAYLTPLLSTLLLVLFGGGQLTAVSLAAMALILGGAILGGRPAAR
ncbi:EamA family transporter [Betaproteobacteria bacterium GR16-43]|nr:EamA family transporter [Betaproteobacteria bacterium GR16-43]